MKRLSREVFIACLILLLASASYVWAQTSEGRPNYRFPKVGQYLVMLGDFHMHTVNSDGKLTPEERVREAWEHGYDVIAITDHAQCPDFRKSYEQALPLAEELGLVLIRGFESGVENKEHFVVLGIDTEYQPRDDHQWAEKPEQKRVFYQEKMREIADLGGFVFHPHPHVGYREPLIWGIEQGIVQGVEVENDVAGQGVGTVRNHGTWWYPFAFQWALDHDLTVFANTDAHHARSSGSQPFTLVFVTQKSDKGVLNALRDRRTVAWFSDMLVGRKDLLTDLIRSMVEISRAPDGDVLLVRNRGPVHLRAYLRDRSGWEEPVDVEPYQDTRVSPDRMPDRLIVFWDNMLTGPRRNLVTTHDIGL